MNKETIKRLILMLLLILITFVYICYTTEINKIIENITSKLIIISTFDIDKLIIIILLLVIIILLLKNRKQKKD